MLDEGRNGPEPTVERDGAGNVVKVTLDADVSVFDSGESLEQQAVILFGEEKHGLPINLAETLEEFFDSYRGPAGPNYGRLKITIEKGAEEGPEGP